MYAVVPEWGMMTAVPLCQASLSCQPKNIIIMNAFEPESDLGACLPQRLCMGVLQGLHLADWEMMATSKVETCLINQLLLDL